MAATKKCRIGVYCAHHEAVHGGEAERLRRAVEKIIEGSSSNSRSALQRMLDDIDAKDALAFLEEVQDEQYKQALQDVIAMTLSVRGDGAERMRKLRYRISKRLCR